MIVAEMFLAQELDELHRYLDEVASRAGSIADAIQAEDETNLDLEFLLEFPIALQGLGIRTVYHELTAILEHHAQAVLRHLRRSLGDDACAAENQPTEMRYGEVQRAIQKLSGMAL